MAPLAGLDYRTCSIRELRRFIRNRSPTKDAPPTKNRPQRRVDEAKLLSTLQQLDDDWRFVKFLELPAEMRNLIYSELLVLDQQSLKCWPQILRTNKEVNEAAMDVFYLHNALPIEVHTIGDSNHSGFYQGTEARCTIYLGKRSFATSSKRPSREIDSRISHFGIMLKKWPTTQLLKATKVHLAILVKPRFWNVPQRRLVGDGGCLHLNNLLYALASLLADAKQIQKVHVKVKFTRQRLAESQEIQDQGRLFYPIIRLMVDDRAVTFEGISPAVQSILLAHKRTASIQLRRPIQTMQELLQSGRRVETLMQDTAQVNDKLKLFAMGTSRLQEHLRTALLIDAKVDKMICDDTTALQVFREDIKEAVDLLEGQVAAAKLQEAEPQADTGMTGTN